MNDTESIDGCAIVELMGHQTIAGHVMTSVLGSNVMLRTRCASARRAARLHALLWHECDL